MEELEELFGKAYDAVVAADKDMAGYRNGLSRALQYSTAGEAGMLVRRSIALQGELEAVLSALATLHAEASAILE